MAPEFKTERLHLRAWREEDLDAFAEINADPRVMEFFPTALTREESDALALRLRAGLEHKPFGLWAVEVVNGAPFIGFVGLSEPAFNAYFTPCIEIGWRLSYPHWGRGYATEAAQAVLRYAFLGMGLGEVVSFTAAGNRRSQNVMRRLGMTSRSSDDFKHPSLPIGHPLQDHVLYRLTRSAWSGQAVREPPLHLP